MSGWSEPAALRAQLLRRWERGEFLRAHVRGEALFPLKLPLKGPSASELANQFTQVAQWAGQWRTQSACRVEEKTVNNRVQGLQTLPHAAWLDSAEVAAAWLGKRRDWVDFVRLAEHTQRTCPALLPWLEKRPLQALELAGVWQPLQAVAEWVCRHPRPGVYLRQVDLPGVSSKFIEAHRAVLAEWLDLLLPGAAIDPTHSGVGGFAARYGFLDKPLRLRLRVLDPACSPLPGGGMPDLTLDSASLARLAPPIEQLFITENEVNFLAFPPVPRAWVLFGAGYGFAALHQLDWPKRLRVRYWGDIDTHGFAILAQLRSHLPHTESLLMDLDTLLAHRALWGREDTPAGADLRGLSAAEAQVYHALRENRYGQALRLEQEHIGFATLLQALAK